VIRRSLACLVALVCCLTLASCTDSSDSAGPGSSGGPSIPTAAKADTEDGVKQFASYWIDTLNEATTSGDTQQLKELALKSCTVCTDFADRLDKIYADGGHVETDGFQVKSATMDAGMTEKAAGVLLNLNATPQTVFEKKGAKPEEHQGGQLRLRMLVSREGDHWLVKEIIPS
jgi:hypothetical protein